ncbi:hypothetical protein IGB42_04147 [Andreprevotia sp. IGB-42]|uniref:hypothetical protein n=1 Tax=Andreprevotia sp. IGB-42 TaxID=2497473 RepID=UPI00135B95A4|nr:hypothetical protein [Andreprevotia sp. IGB-42]KAF0811381.1 hypothetical protein IGB42_04147 [Andreprevotia sp. IGB-42]
MSYVVTGQPALQSEDIDRLLARHPALRHHADGQLAWRDQAGTLRLIQVAPDHLWTDDMRGTAADSFLQQLQPMAQTLDADLLGEEGESLLPQSARSIKQVSKQTSMLTRIGAMGMLLLAPLLAVVMLLYVPMVLARLAWGVRRTGKK